MLKSYGRLIGKVPDLLKHKDTQTVSIFRGGGEYRETIPNKKLTNKFRSTRMTRQTEQLTHIFYQKVLQLLKEKDYSVITGLDNAVGILSCFLLCK